ncbi:hypothetical protein JCM8547_005861 [Rhodosporidiobolus lusitaniae]
MSSSLSTGPPYTASNPPKYVYKLVPHSSVNPRYTFPVPIPASHVFALSELDAKDGYIHLSTAPQLSRTLNRFFPPAEHPKVVVLKMDYKRLKGWKVVKWEEAGSGLFPHLYARLEGENVESFIELEHLPSLSSEAGEKEADGGEGTWDRALEKARGEGWLKD